MIAENPWRVSQFGLPTSIEIGGTEYAIRYDFRDILDIIVMMEDVELDNADKAVGSLIMFYPDYDTIPPEFYQEAIEKCYWFIDGCPTVESKSKKKSPRLIDWQKDFSKIIAPVNRILGYDARGCESLHWLTFMSAFQEIGDCYFAQIVRVRDKKARHKPLDKMDREFYRKNREDIDIKTVYTQQEQEDIKKILGLT